MSIHEDPNSFWAQNARRLRSIGHNSPGITLPLCQVGPATCLATSDNPVCCGDAEIVAKGAGARADFVLRTKAGGAYFGIINFDLFFVGDEVQHGSLWTAGNFFFLVPSELPIERIKEAMRRIPASRELITASRTNVVTGERIEAQIYREHPEAPQR